MSGDFDTAIVAIDNDWVIKNTYTTGSADHTMVEENSGSGVIKQSYTKAIGSDLTEENDGRIIDVYSVNNSVMDYGGGSVEDTYYNSDNTGSNGGTGLTTSEMQGSSASSNMSGFDFSSVWTTVSGDYPELQNNRE